MNTHVLAPEGVVGVTLNGLGLAFLARDVVLELLVLLGSVQAGISLVRESGLLAGDVHLVLKTGVVKGGGLDLILGHLLTHSHGGQGESEKGLDGRHGDEPNALR